MRNYVKVLLLLFTAVPIFSTSYKVGFSNESKDPVYISLDSGTSYLCYIDNSDLVIERKDSGEDEFKLQSIDLFFNRTVLTLKQIKLNNVKHLLLTSKDNKNYYVSILEVTETEVKRIDWLDTDLISQTDIKDINITEIGYEELLITYTNRDEINFLYRYGELINTSAFNFSVKEFDVAMGLQKDEIILNGTFVDNSNRVYKFELVNDNMELIEIDQIHTNEDFDISCGYSLDEGFFKVNLENKESFYEYVISDDSTGKRLIDLSLLGDNYYFKNYDDYEVGFFEYIDNTLIVNDKNINDVVEYLRIDEHLLYKTSDGSLYQYNLLSHSNSLFQVNHQRLILTPERLALINVSGSHIYINIFNMYSEFDLSKTFRIKLQDETEISDCISSIKYKNNLKYKVKNDYIYILNASTSLTSNLLEVDSE